MKSYAYKLLERSKKWILRWASRNDFIIFFGDLLPLVLWSTRKHLVTVIPKLVISKRAGL